MWSDNETDIDLLGFQVHSDLVRSVVTDQSLLPVTVGIFGDWGSGKSSVMKMLERDLQKPDKVACIYFNGWQFEGYDDARSALVHSILLEFGKHAKISVRARKKAASLLSRVDWLRVFSIGYQTIIAPLVASYLATAIGAPSSGLTVPFASASAAVAQSVSDEENLKDIDFAKLLKENPANQGIIGAREFRRDFEDLIGETDLASVVILVDDLDRCEPGRLVETLEAIKLFLAVPHVAFVIGADERIVRYAIAKRYETTQVEAEEGRIAQHSDLVTDYLEKLIQIPYHLPRLSPSELETYMSLLLCQQYLEADFAVVHKAFVQTRRQSMTDVFRHQEIKQALQQGARQCPADLDHELAWCSSIALSLSDMLKGNPRQTKRLLNALQLRRKLAAAAKLDLSHQVLVKLMLLEYTQSDLFAQLYRWQVEQHGVPREIEALEHGPDGDNPDLAKLAKYVVEQDSRWKEPSVQAWIHMQPSLTGRDLRDYFWITRDRITGILAGVATLSSYLRRLLTDLLQAEEGAISPETLSEIDGLSRDDQSALLRELSNSLKRDPQQSQLISTWFALTDHIPTAYDTLIGVLENLPPTSLNGSLPVKLAHMTQTYPTVLEKTEKLLRRWERDDATTRVGRAAKEVLKDLKGGA